MSIRNYGLPEPYVRFETWQERHPFTTAHTDEVSRIAVVGQVFIILLLLRKFCIIVIEQLPYCRLVVRHNMVYIMNYLK